MPLGDVGELMREDGCQLVLIRHQSNQSQMHAKIAARQRKSVDRAVSRQHDAPSETLVHFRRYFAFGSGSLQERLPNTIDILVQQRVV